MQTTTVSIYHFSGFTHRFWALSQMGLAPRRLKGASGLTFFKFLGSGGSNGFGIRPNWSVYGILSVWEDRKAAEAALEENPVYQAYAKRAAEQRHVFLANTMAHGLWDGQMPFRTVKAFDPTAPAAVLTRATIRKRHLWRFWSQVPAVSRSVHAHPGLEYAIGIGELPMVQQATFSLWRTGREMMDFAYRGEHHKRVIAQTRALGWYKEELFARFEVLP
ncbi:MAG: hypothetical protein RMJ33_12745 [Saprospiraceae bacterium]|nr:hypothetical protein [Saprospiraceae bacterium]MDW8230696.1 hypothetical protein [Saprospiraceae bacterium]